MAEKSEFNLASNEPIPDLSNKEVSDRNERLERKINSINFIKKSDKNYFFSYIIEKTKEEEGMNSPIDFEDSIKITEIQNTFSTRDTRMRYITIFGLFAGDEILNRSSLAYRIAHSNSLFRFGMKFLIIPAMTVSFINMLFFTKDRDEKMQSITSKYNIESPEFQEIIQRIAENSLK